MSYPKESDCRNCGETPCGCTFANPGRDVLDAMPKRAHALTFELYDRWVGRTANHPTRTPEEQRAIFALGVGGEAGEVCDLVKKYEAHGRAFKRDELGNEIGDVLWYLSALASTYGLTLEECARMNEEKLRRRWPDGFRVRP